MTSNIKPINGILNAMQLLKKNYSLIFPSMVKLKLVYTYIYKIATNFIRAQQIWELEQLLSIYTCTNKPFSAQCSKYMTFDQNFVYNLRRDLKKKS